MVVHHSYSTADAVNMKEQIEKIQNLPEYEVTSQVESKENQKTSDFLLVSSKSWSDLTQLTKSLKAELPYQILGPHVLGKLLLCHLQIRRSNSLTVTLLLSNK
jgi:hypothetical protein